jgi:O-antigen/teichoic acid export membrane protein
MRQRATPSLGYRVGWQFFHDISVLFTGTLASTVVSFLTQLVLARVLPIADFGRIAALLAAVNFFTPSASVGVQGLLLQVFGREGWSAARWLRPSAILVVLSTCVSSLSFAAYIHYCKLGLGIGEALVLLTSIPILLGQVAVELASTRFQLEDRYGSLAMWQFSTQVGRFAVVIAAAVTQLLSLSTMLAGYAAVGLLTVGAGIVILVKLWSGQIAPRGHAVDQVFSPSLPMDATPSVASTFLRTAPFALITIFYVLYYQGAIVTVQWLAGAPAAAAYNAAYLVMSAIFLVPQVIYVKLLMPQIYRWAEHDRAKFCAAFHVGLPTMTMLGAMLMIATMVTAAWIIPLMFGPKYAGAVPVLLILSLSMPVRFAQQVFSSLFISQGDIVRKATYLAMSAIVGVSASFCLIPWFGVKGAAVATVIAEIMLLLLHVRGTIRFIEGISVLETLRKATFSASFRQLAQRS